MHVLSSPKINQLHTPKHKVLILTNQPRLQQYVAGETDSPEDIFEILPEVFDEFRSRLRCRHGMENLRIGQFRPPIKIFLITNHLRLPEHVEGETDIPDVILDVLPDVFDGFRSRCPQPRRRSGDRRH